MKVAGIPRSTYYYWVKQMNRPDKYKEVKEVIQQIFDEHTGRYGYRRITLELLNRNIKLVIYMNKFVVGPPRLHRTLVFPIVYTSTIAATFQHVYIITPNKIDTELRVFDLFNSNFYFLFSNNKIIFFFIIRHLNKTIFFFIFITIILI